MEVGGTRSSKGTKLPQGGRTVLANLNIQRPGNSKEQKWQLALGLPTFALLKTQQGCYVAVLAVKYDEK